MSFYLKGGHFYERKCIIAQLDQTQIDSQFSCRVILNHCFIHTPQELGRSSHSIVILWPYKTNGIHMQWNGTCSEEMFVSSMSKWPDCDCKMKDQIYSYAIMH